MQRRNGRQHLLLQFKPRQRWAGQQDLFLPFKPTHRLLQARTLCKDQRAQWPQVVPPRPSPTSTAAPPAHMRADVAMEQLQEQQQSLPQLARLFDQPSAHRQANVTVTT